MKAATARSTPAAAREPDTHPFLEPVLEGLSRAAKSLPTAFLYDARGSALFEAICELPEYYPTRTELSIMREHIGAIAAAIGGRAMLVEYGSGASIKTRLLLEHLRDPVAYVPVDISAAHLSSSAAELAARFASVQVMPLCTDFTEPFTVPEPARPPRRRVVYFPGSTIGNFLPHAAVDLMRQMARVTGPDGGLVIGVDLHKPRAVLAAAYDDAAGITAEFNLNLLHRANRELGATFDVSGFAHEAIYDESLARIEMRLRSLRPQHVTIAGRRFGFREGERIHTEYSHKYTIESFAALATRAGWHLRNVWTDPAALFSVHAYARR